MKMFKIGIYVMSGYNGNGIWRDYGQRIQRGM